jgi:hypothetical protein
MAGMILELADVCVEFPAAPEIARISLILLAFIEKPG